MPVTSVKSGSVVLEGLVRNEDFAGALVAADPPSELTLRLQYGRPGEPVLLATDQCL